LPRLRKRIQALPANDLFRPVLLDYTAAIRSVLPEGGVAPFELGGIRVFDALEDLESSVIRCQKKDHKLLRRLIALAKHRLPFAAQVERYRRQRQWLIDLDHLLDPERDPPKTSASVRQAVDHYLVDLTTRSTHNAEDQRVAEHINQIFRSFWWGLFTCYDVEGLPRTNNELERFIRQIKMGHRRVSGRKNVHDFIIRHGAYAALIQPRAWTNCWLVWMKSTRKSS
jgi:hypothetical protein